MSDSKYLKIIDKIRKLLALAQSPNENEAALALAMAKDLIMTSRPRAAIRPLSIIGK